MVSARRIMPLFLRMGHGGFDSRGQSHRRVSRGSLCWRTQTQTHFQTQTQFDLTSACLGHQRAQGTGNSDGTNSASEVETLGRANPNARSLYAHHSRNVPTGIAQRIAVRGSLKP
jgi:hypothetical protein